MTINVKKKNEKLNGIVYAMDNLCYGDNDEFVTGGKHVMKIKVGNEKV